jgi:acetoin utilization deacetylase AcuC-like enzyme
MATRYQQAFNEMWATNTVLFEQFARLKTEDKDFDEIGHKALRIVEETERKLCGKMEGGGYGNYSTNLAEKFRSLVRQSLKYIDFVGVKIE